MTFKLYSITICIKQVASVVKNTSLLPIYGKRISADFCGLALRIVFTLTAPNLKTSRPISNFLPLNNAPVISKQVRETFGVYRPVQYGVMYEKSEGLADFAIPPLERVLTCYELDLT